MVEACARAPSTRVGACAAIKTDSGLGRLWATALQDLIATMFSELTVTGGGKASVELEQFRCVNTLISNIQTALSGTYHAVKFSSVNRAGSPGRRLG